MKCLCPPPDYINVPGEHGFTDTILLKGYNFLFGKKATCECAECGVGLCGDCLEYIIVESDKHGKGGYDSVLLCPSCEEVR